MTPIYSAAFHEVAASTPPRWERERRRQPIRTTLWLGQTPWNSGEETAHNVFAAVSGQGQVPAVTI